MRLRRATPANRAVILVIVLWALVILTALCLALHTLVRSRIWQAGRRAAESRHDQAVASAVALAREILAADGRDVDCLGDSWAAGGQAAFCRELNGGEVLLLAGPEAPLQWGLTDESARLNANTASAEMLGNLAQMTPAAAEAFVADRQALADHITALAADLAGPAAGLTGPIADPDQLRRMLSAAGAPDQLADRLTIWSRAWNLDADGRPRVNLNTATAEELTARFGGELTQLQIRALLIARDREEFHSIGELLTRPMSAPDAQQRNVTVTIPRERFRRIVDRLTVTDAAILPGRVNVNTAPADILACLPGVDSARAADLVDRRGAIDSQQLRTLGWLLDVLTDPQFRQIAPHVTTRSAQFRMLAVSVESPSVPAAFARATLERRGGGIGVLHLERRRRIWDDPRQHTIALTAGPP